MVNFKNVFTWRAFLVLALVGLGALGFFAVPGDSVHAQTLDVTATQAPVLNVLAEPCAGCEGAQQAPQFVQQAVAVRQYTTSCAGSAASCSGSSSYGSLGARRTPVRNTVAAPRRLLGRLFSARSSARCSGSAAASCSGY